MWRYKDFLPIPKGGIVSLGEGKTPLIKLGRVDYALRLRSVYAKFEGTNPTGSFKDRGMSLGISIAKELSVHGVIAASTGNTAASLSAYGARAGLRPVIVLPKGNVALGKLIQVIAHGALTVEITGVFDDALRAVMELIEVSKALYPLNSFNPWRLEGQKTTAYEIIEDLSKVPDWVVVPVGNAGNISAIWKGFKELYDIGVINELPKMVGVQAEGAAPLARAWRLGMNKPLFVDNPPTVATAIKIGKPVNWPKALKAVKESKGLFIEVSDDEVIKAQKDLARSEGIFTEPASAASLAGLRRLVDEGIVGKDDVVVLVLTGHGLKDPDAVRLMSYDKVTISSPKELMEIVKRLMTY